MPARSPSPAAILALLLSSLPAAAAPDADIERAVERHIRYILPAGAPGGVAVAVRIDGRTLFFNFGHADRTGRRPVTTDTLFNLGSVGKVFDAALLADAAGRGEFGLDDPIANHVPDLKTGGDIRRITPRHLATYTSGLVLPQDHPPWPTETFTKPAFFALLKRWTADPAHQPGQQWIYSHAGYELLHLAFEHRFAMPYRDLMRSRLFAPLGLSSTILPVPAADAKTNPRGEIPAELLNRTVQGFDYDGEPVGGPGDLQGYYHWLGAGQMYSSARDMAAFLAANLGERPDLPGLRGAMRLAQQGMFVLERGNSQAMAWVVHGGDIPIVDKFGGLNNASAYIGMIPARTLGVVILANRGSQDLGSAGRAILLELTRP